MIKELVNDTSGGPFDEGPRDDDKQGSHKIAIKCKGMALRREKIYTRQHKGALRSSSRIWTQKNPLVERHERYSIRIRTEHV